MFLEFGAVWSCCVSCRRSTVNGWNACARSACGPPPSRVRTRARLFVTLCPLRFSLPSAILSSRAVFWRSLGLLLSSGASLPARIFSHCRGPFCWKTSGIAALLRLFRGVFHFFLFSPTAAARAARRAVPAADRARLRAGTHKKRRRPPSTPFPPRIIENGF